jgi:uncharacterized membrane protein
VIETGYVGVQDTVESSKSVRNLMKRMLPLCIFVLAATPVAAPILAASHPLAALVIRSFFAHLCHQDPARSFVIGGSPVAVCVRCLGIYCGTAVGALLQLEKPAAWRLLAVAFLFNVLDVVAGTLHWHGNLPLPRFLLGLTLGLAAGAMLFLPGSRRLAGPATANLPGRPLGLR